MPAEGYYAEDDQLTEYFRLIRALQNVGEGAVSLVGLLPEFQRLLQVTSSPLFGRPRYENKLLPTGRDALSDALKATSPAWTVTRLVAAAYSAALEADEISLVGLAARARDPVVLTAVRESVVLYANLMFGAALHPPQPEYVWQVDDELAKSAKRFIDTFNALFDETLPPAAPTHAEQYWQAHRGNFIIGRCVRLGYDDSALPMGHYHWAICRGVDGALIVQEFWKPDVWTTARYRAALHGRGGCPEV